MAHCDGPRPNGEGGVCQAPPDRRILARQPEVCRGWYTRNGIDSRREYAANFALLSQITTGPAKAMRRNAERTKRNRHTRRTTISNPKREGRKPTPNAEPRKWRRPPPYGPSRIGHYINYSPARSGRPYRRNAAAIFLRPSIFRF